MASEENGPLGRVLRAVATGDRPTSGAVDNNLAAQEAKELYDVNILVKLWKILKLLIFFTLRLVKVIEFNRIKKLLS